MTAAPIALSEPAATCPLCGGERRPWLAMPIDAKTFAPTPFGRVTRCAPCGIGAVDPLPAPEEVPAFYRLDAYYTQGASHFALGEPETLIDRARTHLAWRVDRGREQTPADILAALGVVPARPRVLDIGCGDGVMLDGFAALGCEAAGLDPDDMAAARGREAGRDVRHGRAETAAATLKGEHFDVIVMSHALEHCIDPLSALRAVRTLLAPNGVFYCEVPNAAALHFQTFNIVSEMFDAPRHLWFFEPAGLKSLLSLAGLHPKREVFQGFTRHYANAWRATETRIRERLLASGMPSSATPPAHTRWRSLMLLAREAFSHAQRKYDCVGVYAVP